MKTYILLEYKRDITITKLGDKLVNAATRDRQQDIDTIIAALEQMDPTTNKQYVEWLARQYIKQQFRLEDYPRVNDVLVKFEQIKNKLQQRDINQYTFKSLEEVIDKEFNVELKDKVGDSDVPGAKNLYNGPLGRLDVPMTEEAAKILGSGTKWCTAADKNNQFDYYNSQGSIYVWRDKSGEKYQFHFEEQQFMDSSDDPIPHDRLMYFRTKHPVLSKMFRKGEQTYLNDPRIAYHYARDVINGRFEEGEAIIATTPGTAFWYARNVLKDRWKEGEAIIATSPEHSFWYALNIIKDRFEAGEPIIATSPLDSYNYAKDVIKDRFIAGEKSILTSPEYAYWYARDIIKDRWEEGEAIIATHAQYAYWYACNIIHGRFPKGERQINRSLKYKDIYSDFLKYINI